MADVMADPKIQQFMEVTSQQARFQNLIQELTEKCWDSCVGDIGHKLGSRTESCIANCVQRFLDTSNFVANRLESTAGKVPALGGEMLDD